MEIPDIESKHFVDVTLFDIYGNVFQKSVNVSTTAWGRQRMKLEFKGMSQIDFKSILNKVDFLLYPTQKWVIIDLTPNWVFLT